MPSLSSLPLRLRPERMLRLLRFEEEDPLRLMCLRPRGTDLRSQPHNSSKFTWPRGDDTIQAMDASAAITRSSYEGMQ